MGSRDTDGNEQLLNVWQQWVSKSAEQARAEKAKATSRESQIGSSSVRTKLIVDLMHGLTKLRDLRYEQGSLTTVLSRSPEVIVRRKPMYT